VTGTINGAATLLGVSAPGISRLVKHTEESLGLRLFERKGGLFVPSVEASAIFDQIGRVYKNVENLSLAIASLQRGEAVDLSFASAPSVAQFIAARAVRRVRQRFPDLFIDLNILKIEETIDYLMLDRGEFVMMSTAIENAGITNEIAAQGRLAAIVPEGHELAGRDQVSVHDLVRFPMIGVEPNDPYGSVCTRPLRDAGLPVMDSVTHIVPLMVGDPVHAKKISDILLAEYGVYVQPINFPTVPRGTERLRFTPSPVHGPREMDALVGAMDDLWSHCALNRADLSA
ncbi:aminotransferase class I/II-fold pyridoxal phosphate-dependent enzyme, partial [Marinovum algicola]|uniref:aminotransferase class I/II-fold pyridoxal phosphate-dependent enzyme n=1 Tax=Marinovum algicola TaxID=42444 RepID=UPI00321801AA